MSEYISAEQAAARLGVHPQTIRDYVRRGTLTAYGIRGSRLTRFKADDVEALFVPKNGGGDDAA